MNTTRSAIDHLVSNNDRYAEGFGEQDLGGEPARRVAVVTCMDARIDVFAALGLANGEAHIIRNSGGVVTDDVIRSLCLSQRLLGTREIMLIHHTDCGLQGVDEVEFRHGLEAELGVKPSWSVEAFDNPYDDIRQSIQRVYMSPFLPHKETVRGFVYSVADGHLREVSLDGSTQIAD